MDVQPFIVEMTVMWVQLRVNCFQTPLEHNSWRFLCHFFISAHLTGDQQIFTWKQQSRVGVYLLLRAAHTFPGQSEGRRLERLDLCLSWELQECGTNASMSVANPPPPKSVLKNSTRLPGKLFFSFILASDASDACPVLLSKFHGQNAPQICCKEVCWSLTTGFISAPWGVTWAGCREFITWWKGRITTQNLISSS